VTESLSLPVHILVLADESDDEFHSLVDAPDVLSR
jgi:hypothetical protein